MTRRSRSAKRVGLKEEDVETKTEETTLEVEPSLLGKMEAGLSKAGPSSLGKMELEQSSLGKENETKERRPKRRNREVLPVLMDEGVEGEASSRPEVAKNVLMDGVEGASASFAPLPVAPLVPVANPLSAPVSAAAVPPAAAAVPPPAAAPVSPALVDPSEDLNHTEIPVESRPRPSQRENTPTTAAAARFAALAANRARSFALGRGFVDDADRERMEDEERERSNLPPNLGRPSLDDDGDIWPGPYSTGRDLLNRRSAVAAARQAWMLSKQAKPSWTPKGTIRLQQNSSVPPPPLSTLVW